jgi:hypothetical protein
MSDRREFITLLGGAAAWPLAARAQQERMRRIGVLMYWTADDAEGQARYAAFMQALKQLGWNDGGNLRIDTRWATADDVRRHAAELVALAPNVLVAAGGTATVAPLLEATRTVPIVFVAVIDPVGAGFVASLARPGGNATGFTIFEYSTGIRAAEEQIVTVHKDPSCGCCAGWVRHLQQAGFTVKTIESADLDPVKTRLGVPADLAACHTAQIGRYVIEGHVPAVALRRLPSVQRETARVHHATRRRCGLAARGACAAAGDAGGRVSKCSVARTGCTQLGRIPAWPQ